MDPWNPLSDLVRQIGIHGGFVNAHAHFDRAYTIKSKMMDKTQQHLFEKWEYVDNFKRNATVDDYLKNIKTAVDMQMFLSTRAACTFVDIDPICEYNAITAAKIAQEHFGNQFPLVVACQTLKGVLEKKPRQLIEKAMNDFQIIGGLPAKDKGKEAEHIDQLMNWAKDTGKRVHVHVDQLNHPSEKETELLARKTIEYGLEGMVSAVHSISLAAHPKAYREEVYKICKDANLSFITCPSAWIDHPRREDLVPSHNALTPVDELLERGLTVALGSDNICDVYKPFCDGDMINELRLLIDGCKIYDHDALLEICVYNGLEVIGLSDDLGEV
ncbi:TPA: amidohydrolase family protein [Candidatus Woesearchaeota archaeon]|nr:amidohydrolase family protein [Candidatus Woesearchaeota archaeon]